MGRMCNISQALSGPITQKNPFTGDPLEPPPTAKRSWGAGRRRRREWASVGMYSKGEGGKEEGGKERKKRDLVATSFQTSDSNHGLVCLRHVPRASTSLSVCVCVVLGLSLFVNG